MNNKNKNAGFTLVELIIAIAILGIVISPLVSNFIQSGKINKKSKISLNSTAMAQDIMEGLSTYTAEEVINMFESEETLQGKILPQNITYTSHGDQVYTATNGAFDTSSDAIGDRQYSLRVVGGVSQKAVIDKAATDRSLDTYDFYIRDIVWNKDNYDVHLEMKTADHTVYNGKKVANVSNINQTYDATHTIDANEYANSENVLLNRSSKVGTLGANDFTGKIKRDIIININDAGTAGAPDYSVGVQCDYSVLPEYYTELGLTSGNAKESVVVGNISSLSSTQLPRSVYLYYEGMPNSTMSSRLDNFHVNNNTGQEITVYLIRTQDGVPDATDTTKQLYNVNYGTTLEVVSTDLAGTPNELTDIVYNMRFNLSLTLEDNVRKFEEGSMTELVKDNPIVTSTTVTYYNPNRCTLQYNGTAVTEDFYKEHFFDGYRKDIKNMLYDVTIEIFDKDAGMTGRPIVTFTGGLSE